LQTKDGDCGHFIFEGPPGVGKRTMIWALLREVFGAEKVQVHNLILITEYQTLPTDSTFIIINICDLAIFVLHLFLYLCSHLASLIHVVKCMNVTSLINLIFSLRLSRIRVNLIYLVHKSWQCAYQSLLMLLHLQAREVLKVFDLKVRELELRQFIFYADSCLLHLFFLVNSTILEKEHMLSHPRKDKREIRVLKGVRDSVKKKME